MPLDAQELERRVIAFKLDLGQMETIDVIRKHITTGGPAVFADAAYYDLRNEVAHHFDLHPSSVVIVGSCRVGFSIKPNVIVQRFRRQLRDRFIRDGLVSHWQKLRRRATGAQRGDRLGQIV